MAYDLTIRVAFLGLSATLVPFVAQADADCSSPQPIVFDTGQSRATVSGELVRYEDACYRLNAKAGQHLQVVIRSPDQNVVFSLYQPGWRVVASPSDGPEILGTTVPGAGDENDATSIGATLHRSGPYLLNLGLSRGGGGEYSLVISMR